jgi:hypothetical protein
MIWVLDVVSENRLRDGIQGFIKSKCVHKLAIKAKFLEVMWFVIWQDLQGLSLSFTSCLSKLR